jgi:hypothetical protein
MALTRAQNRWRLPIEPPIEKVDKSRDLPKAAPPTPSREAQHPLPPAQLRAQLVQEYKAANDGESPDRDWLTKEMWKRVGVNSVAELRFKRSTRE